MGIDAVPPLVNVSAYILVAHGSRDVRSQTALTQLANLFRQVVSAEPVPPPVATATLEFGPPLAEQLQTLGEQLGMAQVCACHILPLFLLPGTHAKVDVPEAVAMAQQALGPQLPLILHPSLGEHPDLVALLCDRIPSQPPHPWILIAHGSRYPGGNQAILHLTERVGATPAFCTGDPSLETTVAALVSQGHQKIGVFPYFLFSGSITDTIMATVHQLRLRFIEQELELLSPLNPSLDLAQLLLTL